MTRKPGVQALLRGIGDEYEVVRELGRGGTSTVYLAHDGRHKRDVAIKVIRASHLDDAEAVERLEREARILSRLKHPCIVRLLDTRRLDDGRIALIMEYVRGRTLKDVIRDGGPLPIRTVERVLVDITSALEHAAEHEVVHRDIKPENIFIDEDGRALLADFGIARIGQASSTVTLSGGAIGTPAYMSPEQIDGGRIDARSDLYSLGMTAYEMLTGQTPWAGENLYTVIYRQKHTELRPLREVRPDTPPHMLRAVSGLVRKHPVARWNTAADFRAHLEQGIAASAGTTPAPGTVINTTLSVVTENSPTLRIARAALPSPVPERGVAASDAKPASAHALPLDASAATPNALVIANAAVTPDTAEPFPVAPGIAGRGSVTAAPSQNESEVLLAKRRAARVAKPTQAGRARRRRRAVLVATVLVIAASGATVAMIAERNASRAEEPIPDMPFPAAAPTATSAEFPTAPDVSAPLAPGDTSADTGPAPSAQPARVTVLTGNGQSAVAGDVLTAPIAVRVDDENGDPVSNARVVFRVARGGGNVAPAEALTDSRGRAAAAWALGTTAGANTLAVSVRDAPQAAARIAATGTTGAPARIVVVDGNDRTGSVPSRSVSFRVEDRNGNPVPGARVNVRVAAGGGSVEPASLTTSADGVAETTWVLGPDSANRIIGALPGTSITADFVPPPFRVAARPGVAAGGTHSCSLTASGAIRCWGGNEQGQLGASRTTRQEGLVRVPGATPFTRIAAGITHTCALDAAGVIACWGLNTSGQLGTGDRTTRQSPTALSGGPRVLEIAAGLAHTCAIAEGGAALCWGAGDAGQTGLGATVNRASPAPVAGGHTFGALTAGWHHTCALTPRNAAWCWGSNADGQLGDGSTAGRPAPVRVAGNHRFASISAGASHTCGVTTAGEAYCWGGNDNSQTGQAGNGSREPVAVSAPAAFASIVAGALHTCALTRSGEAYCWGRNNFGQLGNESTADSAEPVRVSGGLRFSALSASGSHTCGRTTAGQDYCWGYNVEGQLGDGTRTNRSRPVRVGSSD